MEISKDVVFVALQIESAFLAKRHDHRTASTEDSGAKIDLLAGNIASTYFSVQDPLIDIARQYFLPGRAFY